MVITNVNASNEQIKKNIYIGIKRVLDDKELFNNIKNKLDKEIVDSTNEISKLYEV